MALESHILTLESVALNWSCSRGIQWLLRLHLNRFSSLEAFWNHVWQDLIMWNSVKYYPNSGHKLIRDVCIAGLCWRDRDQPCPPTWQQPEWLALLIKTQCTLVSLWANGSHVQALWLWTHWFLWHRAGAGGITLQEVTRGKKLPMVPTTVD